MIGMLMKTRFGAAVLIALSSGLAPAALAAPKFATNVVSQLPRSARPLHYQIRVTPDAKSLRFSGTVKIDIELLITSSSLTLNAADLELASAQILRRGAAPRAAKISYDRAGETVTLDFGSALPIGKYALEIAYGGQINRQANGLFALDYRDPQGKDQRALFTQFEAPDARRFVPSWDEPNFRTSFALSAVVPHDQMAVSNMPIATRTPIGGELDEVRFATTPRMSTYLLFFGTGAFDRITTRAGKTEVGVVMGKGNAEKARWALSASAAILPYYEQYFGTKFPLPKLDNVAGPGESQFFSAMENWGAIFSFERILLDDPKLTTARGRRAIFTVAAHEIAHQWFGDLVTMQWWDDLWLNEGFASWMASRATAKLHPEWRTDLDLIDSRESAMGLDAFVTTHPVVQQIKTVDQISQAFDAITYKKGEAVITMLEGFAGEAVWQRGLQRYIRDHAYGNTQTIDLWNAVEAAGAKGLVTIARDFTNQPGVPLIRVDSAQCVNGQTEIKLTQSEYSRDQRDARLAKPLRWNVPIRAQTFGAPVVQTIVANGSASMTLTGCGALLVNAGQSGYFRTLYPQAQRAQLVVRFAELASIDQLGLIADGYALGIAGHQPLDSALDLMAAAPAEAQPKLIGKVASQWKEIFKSFDGDADGQARIAARAIAQLSPVMARLGFEPRADESSSDTLLRGDLIGVLGTLGDPLVLAQARARFAALAANPVALDGPLKQIWLDVIGEQADASTWDQLHAMAKVADGQVLKSSLYRLLGGARDSTLADKALALALTDEPGPTISGAMISAVAAVHPDRAVAFAVEHREAVEKLVDSSSRSRYIARLAGTSRSAATLDALEGYARAYLAPEARKPIDQAQALIRARIADEPRIRGDVRGWLDRAGR